MSPPLTSGPSFMHLFSPFNLGAWGPALAGSVNHGGPAKSGLCDAELTSLPAMEQEWQGPAMCYFLPRSGKLRLESADAHQQMPPTARSCKCSCLLGSAPVLGQPAVPRLSSSFYCSSTAFVSQPSRGRTHHASGCLAFPIHMPPLEAMCRTETSRAMVVSLRVR